MPRINVTCLQHVVSFAYEGLAKKKLYFYLNPFRTLLTFIFDQIFQFIDN